MSASVVSPYMFRSYTWPSSGDVPCTMLLSALLLRHDFTWVCGHIFYLCCCHVYLSAGGLVGWHNRRRHSNVLKSDCVLVCILKHSAWVWFLNNVRHKPAVPTQHSMWWLPGIKWLEPHTIHVYLVPKLSLHATHPFFPQMRLSCA